MHPGDLDYEDPGLTVDAVPGASNKRIFSEIMVVMEGIFTARETTYKALLLEDLAHVQQKIEQLGTDSTTPTQKEMDALQNEMLRIKREIERGNTALCFDGASEHMQWAFEADGGFTDNAKNWIQKKRKLLKFCNALSLLMQPLDQMGSEKGTTGTTGFPGVHAYFEYETFVAKPDPPKFTEVEKFVRKYITGPEVHTFEPSVQRSFAAILRHWLPCAEECFGTNKKIRTFVRCHLGYLEDSNESKQKEAQAILSGDPKFAKMTEVHGTQLMAAIPKLLELGAEQSRIKDAQLAELFPELPCMQQQPTDFNRDESVTWDRQRTMMVLHPDIEKAAISAREKREEKERDATAALEARSKKSEEARLAKEAVTAKKQLAASVASAKSIMCNACSSAHPKGWSSWALCPGTGTGTGKNEGCTWHFCPEDDCQAFMQSHVDKPCQFIVPATSTADTTPPKKEKKRKTPTAVEDAAGTAAPAILAPKEKKKRPEPLIEALSAVEVAGPAMPSMSAIAPPKKRKNSVKSSGAEVVEHLPPKKGRKRSADEHLPTSNPYSKKFRPNPSR